MVKRLLLVFIALLFLAFSIYTTLPTEAQTSTALAAVPNGLKPYFALGFANRADNITWMKNSGVTWGYRSQYLTGGANKTSGWSSWDKPAGQFANVIMNESASNGFMPVLTYYQILPSSPATGSNESQKDFNNLNNKSTMSAYFADFKLLMDRAKIFGKTVIVQVEPDMWGFLQRMSPDPNTLSAAVKSSGYADVAGYPDTVSGFARALVGLRNKYAPNVLLAYHISIWGSSYGDIGSSHYTDFNVQGAAQETANFYLKTGANYDLLFYDIADADAALKTSQGNNATWWDLKNVTYPNFNRFHAFARTVNTMTSKRAILWQVPVGNTVYSSMNNTAHHWQDNKVQYYLNNDGTQHLQDLMNSGFIGIIFAEGSGVTTSYSDNAKDGVTNPAPINGNNLVATLPDDDGGYLRLQTKNYYSKTPLALPASLSVQNAVPAGDGLTGAYFANRTLTGPATLSRVDPSINYSWSSSPGQGIPADNFSARWTGRLLAPTTETFTFCTKSDDGVRLWVGGTLLVDNWTNHSATENCGSMALQQGKYYDLKLEYFEYNYDAIIKLFWQSPSISKEIIPQANLFSK
ncbi:MAG: hypothetical protein J0I20_06070 [Chloroflexi bacterium]|nr:hypothetical protein [Chloroflexota bacterium]OJV90159.1 MAG: hypothetical protein BGO39_02000 [Chloroflexi bacterium 54-19]